MQNWLWEKILILMEKTDICVSIVNVNYKKMSVNLLITLLIKRRPLKRNNIISGVHCWVWYQWDRWYHSLPRNNVDFINVLNLGGLTFPPDSCVQWIIFCYMLFTQLTDDFCRSFLNKQFDSIALIAYKYNRSIVKNLLTSWPRIIIFWKLVEAQMQPESTEIILELYLLKKIYVSI